MRGLPAALLLAGLAPAALARPAPLPDACPAERATYRLDAEEVFVAELRPGLRGIGAASDLALRIRSAATRRDYWFIFAAAQGYGGLSVIAMRPAPGGVLAEYPEAPGTTGVLAFHAVLPDMRLAPAPPVSGEPAPRWLFIPELGRALHYEELPGQAGQERMPPAFWVLSACRPPV